MLSEPESANVTEDLFHKTYTGVQLWHVWFLTCVVSWFLAQAQSELYHHVKHRRVLGSVGPNIESHKEKPRFFPHVWFSVLFLRSGLSCFFNQEELRQASEDQPMSRIG